MYQSRSYNQSRSCVRTARAHRQRSTAPTTHVKARPLPPAHVLERAGCGRVCDELEQLVAQLARLGPLAVVNQLNNLAAFGRHGCIVCMRSDVCGVSSKTAAVHQLDDLTSTTAAARVMSHMPAVTVHAVRKRNFQGPKAQVWAVPIYGGMEQVAKRQKPQRRRPPPFSAPSPRPGSPLPASSAACR